MVTTNVYIGPEQSTSRKHERNLLAMFSDIWPFAPPITDPHSSHHSKFAFQVRRSSQRHSLSNTSAGTLAGSSLHFWGSILMSSASVNPMIHPPCHLHLPQSGRTPCNQALLVRNRRHSGLDVFSSARWLLQSGQPCLSDLDI
jgi:hypothetical protein